MKLKKCQKCNKEFEDYILKVGISCIRRYCPHCNFNLGIKIGGRWWKKIKGEKKIKEKIIIFLYRRNQPYSSTTEPSNPRLNHYRNLWSGTIWMSVFSYLIICSWVVSVILFFSSSTFWRGLYIFYKYQYIKIYII